MKTFEGKLTAQNMRIGIVASRFNEFITSRLLGGALDGLKRRGVSEEEIQVAWVPGAFEIPLIASKTVSYTHLLPLFRLSIFFFHLAASASAQARKPCSA